MTTILAVNGDWHVNDTNGLCPPRFRRERDSTHHPDKFQRAIWTGWLEYWDVVAQYKKKLKSPVVGVFNGDLGDINSHSKSQLISLLKNDIQRAMADVASPALEVTDYNVVIRGTEAHVGGCGELEEWFADDISAEPSPEGQASWWIWRAEIEGVRIHATHHPPTITKLPNKRGQAVARMCERLASEYDIYGWEKKPQLAFWSHVHWSARGYEMGIEGWTVPPWKGMDSYTHRLGITLPSPVGGLICIVDKGAWEVKQFIRRPPRLRGTTWTIPS